MREVEGKEGGDGDVGGERRLKKEGERERGSEEEVN